MPLRALPVRRPPSPKADFAEDDTAPTRIDPVPVRRLGPARPAWSRGLAGKSDREVAALARAFEAEIYARIELVRRREGASPSASAIREMLADVSRVERHADNIPELCFLYIFWHAFKTRLECSARFVVLAQLAEKMMRETARALGALKRRCLADTLVAIEDESRLPCVRVAAALAAARLFELAHFFAAIALCDEARIAGGLEIHAEEVLFEPIGWNGTSTYTIVLPLPGAKGFALRLTLDGALQITLTHGSRLDIDLLASNATSAVEDHARRLTAANPMFATLRETARRAPDVGRLERSLTAMEETLADEPFRRPNAIAAVRKLCNEIYTWPNLVHDLPWGPHPSFRALLARAMTILGLPPAPGDSVHVMRERLLAEARALAS